MKLKEAYDILGVNFNTPLDDIKKIYKKKVLECHPDIHKSDDNERKIKLLNEAYQRIQSGEDDVINMPNVGGNPFYGSPFGDINFDFFNPFGRTTFRRSKQINAQDIMQFITIDFKSSILGCKQHLKYTRTIKCDDCDGQGSKRVSNCTSCNGNGQKTTKKGAAVFIQTCPDCQGKFNFHPCTKCNQQGTLTNETSINVSVPPGVVNNNILKISNMGNYSNTIFGVDQYTDVLLKIQVAPNPYLHLEGEDVVSNLNISLLEALKGTTKSVETIDGYQNVSISPLFKNKDEIILSNLGVGRKGHQRVIINVNYPDNVDNLIKSLEENA